MTQPFQIPDKATFKIGEVARMLDVEAHVLRYWESEFEELRPSKTKSGQRIYSPEDIRLTARIRELLYTEMYTIAGARRQLTLDRDGELDTRISSAELDALRETGVAAEAERDELVLQVQELQQSLEEAQAREESLQEELRQAAQEQEVLAAQVEALHQQLDTTRERLEARAAQVAAFEAASSSSDDIEEHWREIADQLKSQITTLEEELDEARSRSRSVRTERDELEVHHEALRREARHQRQRRRELVEAVRGQLAQLAAVSQRALDVA